MDEPARHALVHWDERVIHHVVEVDVHVRPAGL